MKTINDHIKDSFRFSFKVLRTAKIKKIKLPSFLSTLKLLHI